MAGLFTPPSLRSAISDGVARTWLSNVAVPLTGTTNETALATISIPAGAMGTSRILRVTTIWTSTTAGSAKTCRVRFGGIAGTSYAAITLSSTTITARSQIQIGNRGSASSQIGGSAVFAGFGTSTSANITSSVNTANAVDLVLSGTLVSGADTVTLESYLVELIG